MEDIFYGKSLTLSLKWKSFSVEIVARISANFERKRCSTTIELGKLQLHNQFLGNKRKHMAVRR